MDNRIRKRKFYICYTAAFVILGFLVFGNHFFQDKSFVRYSDGLNQYLYSLCYYGEYLREIIRNIFIEHTFEIPMWDMSIGLGSDILTTLHYYVIGDPLNLLSAFVNGEYMIYLFCGLIIVRMFLAGLSFSYFCFFHGNNEEATLFGTLIYCFSGWCLLMGMKYASFLNVMIYFPLLLVGIDKIYRKKSPVLFVVMTGISAISNFYFFYMLCIFMFIYAVSRYFHYQKKPCFKSILKWLVLFIVYFGIGILISSFILIPNISVLLSGKRMEVDFVVPVLFSISYYLSIPLSFTVFWNFGGEGFTPFVIPALVILFRKKSEKSLKIGFLLLLVFMCIPFWGHAMNGFSYVSNRWFWAMTLFMCYIIVKFYPEFFHLSQKECICVGIVGMGYVFLWLVVLSKWYESLFLFLVCLLFVIILSNCKKEKKSCIRMLSLYAAIFLCIAVNSRNIYLDETTSEGIVNNVSLVKSDSLYSDAPSASIKEKFEVRQDFRYDQFFPNSLISINTPMLNHVNGMQFYFSLADGAIEDFFDELYINAPCDFQYAGFDSRTILNAISAVKYGLAEKDGTQPIPWGYDKSELSLDKQYVIFEQNKYLPFGFTYSSYVPESVWREKDVVQKQAVFLESVVLKDSKFEIIEPMYKDIKMNYTISNCDGITVLENGNLQTTKDSSMTLSFEGLENSENYIVFENLNFVGEDTSSDIRLCGKGYEKTIRFFTNQYDQYSGKHNFLCNMGYSEEPVNEIKIIFDKEGVYSFDNISVVCQPTGDFATSIDRLKEEPLEDVSIDTNKITGNITLETSKILFFSVPYSKGWTLLVDGVEQELKQANIMFMATELEKGHHTIELLYQTPYLKLGFCFSILGLLLLISVLGYYYKKERLY